jgi:Ion channel
VTTRNLLPGLRPDPRLASQWGLCCERRDQPPHWSPSTTCCPWTGPRLFLLLFASTYVVRARFPPPTSEPLTRTGALYFTVTVFATVGFGDITDKTEAARLVVTGQMIVALVAVGLAVKVIVGAVKRGHQGSQ